MGKTRSWMNYVKRLFTPNSKPKSKSQEKSGNRGRVANKKLKFRRRSCYLAIEETPRSTLNEAAEEQRKRAVAVAVATAAAAEAAMASVNAAVEVVRLANSPYDAERKISEMAAAIKIQAAYRGHLAKKALHALKGIVKLQAVVRGQLTRKSVSFLVRRTRVAVPLLDYPSHGQTRRSSILNEGIEFGEHKLHCNTRMVSKGSGIAERECMRRYSFSHQEKKNDQNSLLSRLNTIAVDTTRPTKLKVDTTRKHGKVEDSKSPSSQPRRSFCHVKQNSTGDNVSSLPNSPAYMAATECTKAKLRSLSTPRQRLRLYDTYSGPDSPYKLSLSSGGSFNGEMIARTHKRK